MKRTLTAFLVLVAAPALAQSSQDTVKIIQEADKVVVRKKTVVDFTDVTVDGELTRPEGSYVLNKKKTRFKSLIKVRDNFNPELQKSVDNL
jgi:ribosomal protein L36